MPTVRESRYVRISAAGAKLEHVRTLDEGTVANSDDDEHVDSDTGANSSDDVILDEGHY